MNSMLHFLQEDPETYRAFQELIRKIHSNSIGQTMDQVEDEILEKMEAIGCNGNHPKTQAYIVHTYHLAGRVGPVIKPRGIRL